MSGSDHERYGPDGPRIDRTGKNKAVNDGRDGREERHGRDTPATPSEDRGPSWGTDGARAADGSDTFPGAGVRDTFPGGGVSDTFPGATGSDTFPGATGNGAFPGGGGAFPGPRAAAQASPGSSRPGTTHPFAAPGRQAAPGPRAVPGGRRPATGPHAATAALSPDELAVRRLMQGAVQDLEPSDGALDHLRRAVPQRRTRRRQAVVGAAAAALLIGTAIPAFLHVSRSGSTTTAHSANAGHSQSADGSDDGTTGTGSDGTGQGPADPQDRTPGKTTGKGPDGKTQAPVPGVPDTGQGDTDGADAHRPDAYEQSTDEPEKPACDGNQLEVIKATTGAPDATGKVYGAFRIANKSGAECAVPGEGRMNFQAMGAADQKRIKVVEHKQGDPAVGLPDPAKEARSLVLPPEAVYEVQFAWVPQDTCPSTGGATPKPTPTGENPGAGGTDGGTPGGEPGGKVPETSPDEAKSTGTTTQLLTGDGDPADGKVAVTHTPEEGAPSAATTIPNACAGTIYRTGVLDAP
ncbi:hypothetical protein ACIO3O_28645 [Streptomyces sp. NPDC087440]|uniref:hypothetical protein n=1 Tax=Streptomyces sp. NPDC087440 TaxID=3365790 RepID=UPI0038150A4F